MDQPEWQNFSESFVVASGVMDVWGKLCDAGITCYLHAHLENFNGIDRYPLCVGRPGCGCMF